jgi:bacillithiol biosynthesis deacetylase BshB1
MKIVFFGIHPDDVELGCGGTAALASLQGHEVNLVDLSPGSSASNGTEQERAQEAQKAAEILGAGRRINLELPDTKIHSEDAEQTRKVVECIRKLRPELVFIPNKQDPHPDHASGGELIERSLYLSGIHGYEAQLPAWSSKNAFVYAGRLDFVPTFIVDVTKTHSAKMKAVRAHKSQFILEKGRKKTVLNSPEFLLFLEARSRVYGHKIDASYGEPFRALYPLALYDLSIITSSLGS